MTKPRYTDLIASLPATVPFVGPEQQERARGEAFKARLGANESVFGPSPRAIEAMQKAASEIWKYADPTHFDLKNALAAHLGCDTGNLLIGEGIDGLLGGLVRLLIGPGDTVVTSLGAYPTFNYHVAGFGGTLHTVPYLYDHEDIEGLLAQAHKVQAKILYLANPDNPMGTWHSGAEIASLRDRLPDGCLLVLDEAYVEFAPAQAVPQIGFDDPGVIRMRTFSKAYGLAGARVGYAIAAPELITAFDKIRNHFGMNRAALAGALAALNDQDWLAHVQAQVAQGRDMIDQIARDNGLVTIPSATNFVAIDCGADGAFARRVLGALGREGIFVRMPFVAPQDRCIRVSVGDKRDLSLFAAALPRALAEARFTKS